MEQTKVAAGDLDVLARVASLLEKRIDEREQWMMADAGIAPEFYPGNPKEDRAQEFDNVFLVGIYDRIEAEHRLDYTGNNVLDDPELGVWTIEQIEDMRNYEAHMFDDMTTEEWLSYMAVGYGPEIRLQYERGRHGSVGGFAFDLDHGLI